MARKSQNIACSIFNWARAYLHSTVYVSIESSTKKNHTLKKSSNFFFFSISG